jgi:hypothetical protein
VNRFRYIFVAIYILFAVCIQTSVSFYTISRDLVQKKLVKCTMSDGVVYTHFQFYKIYTSLEESRGTTNYVLVGEKLKRKAAGKIQPKPLQVHIISLDLVPTASSGSHD